VASWAAEKVRRIRKLNRGVLDSNNYEEDEGDIDNVFLGKGEEGKKEVTLSAFSRPERFLQGETGSGDTDIQKVMKERMNFKKIIGIGGFK
jgi:hypothetical protein